MISRALHGTETTATKATGLSCMCFPPIKKFTAQASLTVLRQQDRFAKIEYLIDVYSRLRERRFDLICFVSQRKGSGGADDAIVVPDKNDHTASGFTVGLQVPLLIAQVSIIQIRKFPEDTN